MVDPNESPNPSSEEERETRLDAAFAAYLRLCDASQGSDDWLVVDDEEARGRRDAFLQRYPELQPELGKLIATADMLQRFVGSESSTANDHVSPNADTIGAAFTGHKKDPPSAASSNNAEDETGGNEHGSDLNLQSSDVASATGGGVPSTEIEKHGLEGIIAHEVVSVGAGTALTQLENIAGGIDANEDPNNATLPVGDRNEDTSGPSLPYDLGDYSLQELIGRGGMGMVYRATQKGLQRDVAVKMIRSGLFAGDDEVRRFRTEARAAASLTHPNIVTVHHFGYLEGHHYFSMDFVEGTDLSRKMSQGPLPFMEAARYVRDCALAIHYAHQRGILHRDIKPANILIDEEDSVRITDFGLAKHTDTESSITGSGAAVGTPHYMAPEQALGRGDRADCTADVYSLGAVLFALVTGRPPFQGETVVQTLMQVVHRATPSPRDFRPDVPGDLETILLKCLEKDPSDRYASAEQLAEELNRFLQGRPVEAKARGHVQQLWNWVNDVPVVAALRGRKFVDPSVTHRRFQSAMLALLILIPLALLSLVFVAEWNQARMPGYVRIAGGLSGGVYDEISGEIALRVSRSQGVDATVMASDGSIQNRQRLLEGTVHLAPLQASTVRGENLAVVAPLFYEMVHVLVRPSSEIASINEMRGRKIAVGPEGSGSHLAAELLFDAYGIGGEDVELHVIDWSEIDSIGDLDGAIVCIGTGSEIVTEMLQEGTFSILPIRDAYKVSAEHPALRSLQITPEEYEAGLIPEDGIPTVGMPAFLVARFDTPAVLVRAALDAIYSVPPVDERMISKKAAAEFQGMQLHPEARRYFDE